MEVVIESEESERKSFFASQIFQNSKAVAEDHSGRDRYRRVLIAIWFFGWIGAFLLAAHRPNHIFTRLYVPGLVLITFSGVSFFAFWCLYSLRWCSVERTVLNMYLALEILAALALSLVLGLSYVSFYGITSLVDSSTQHLVMNVKLMTATCAAQIAATNVKISWVTLLNQRSDLIQDREFFELVGREIEGAEEEA